MKEYVSLTVAAFVVLLSLLRLTPKLCGVYHDDGIYVSTAKALAEHQGYHLINLPGAPPQTKYPILYPAILAALWTLWPHFPDNILQLQLFSVACAACFLGFAYRYLVTYEYGSRRLRGREFV